MFLHKILFVEINESLHSLSDHIPQMFVEFKILNQVGRKWIQENSFRFILSQKE